MKRIVTFLTQSMVLVAAMMLTANAATPAKLVSEELVETPVNTGKGSFVLAMLGLVLLVLGVVFTLSRRKTTIKAG